MSDRIIVSKELEDVIDKKNVFGNEITGDIPLTLWAGDSIIRSDIERTIINKNRLKVEFITTPRLAQELLVSNTIKRITIGDESFKTIEFDNCDIKSLTVSAHEDMYLCRIIISTAE